MDLYGGMDLQRAPRLAARRRRGKQRGPPGRRHVKHRGRRGGRRQGSNRLESPGSPGVGPRPFYSQVMAPVEAGPAMGQNQVCFSGDGQWRGT